MNEICRTRGDSDEHDVHQGHAQFNGGTKTKWHLLCLCFGLGDALCFCRREAEELLDAAVIWLHHVRAHRRPQRLVFCRDTRRAGLYLVRRGTGGVCSETSEDSRVTALDGSFCQFNFFILRVGQGVGLTQ